MKLKSVQKCDPNLNPNSGQVGVELRLMLRLKLRSSFLTLKHPIMAPSSHNTKHWQTRDMNQKQQVAFQVGDLVYLSRAINPYKIVRDFGNMFLQLHPPTYLIR